MGNVNIKFNNKEYLLSCDEGQEEHLEELSVILNRKFEELKKNLGNIGENKLLLISSIKFIDEYFETKKKLDIQKNELSEIKERFKKLKNLVIEYKTEKENEIKELEDNQNIIKLNLENQKNDYESLIDKVTIDIEKFINNINTEKSI